MSTRTVTRPPVPGPPRRTLLWVILILSVALAGNGLAYVLMHRSRPETAPPPAAPAAAAAPADDGDEGLARARRASGIAALEHRDYDRAVTELTEALRLRKDKGDLVELLKIANELRARDKVRPGPPAVASAPAPAAPPEPAPSPSRTPSRPSKPVRVATRTPAPPPAEPAAAPEPPRNGLLLVTSTPPGLVVAVDGKTMDLTPARVPVKAGSHRVTLAQGERRVLDETVEVGEDAVRPINWEAKAEPPPPPVAKAEPPPAPVTPASTAAAKPPPPEPTAPALPPPAATGKGDLEVTSPSLYGEIWINDRPYGFPPVTARGLPAGKARVEVRVQGAVKRKMTVDVVPGTSTPVRVR
jgi:PEGA domain-containing protein